MKGWLGFALVAPLWAGAVDEFQQAAAEQHGERGRRAAAFLVEHMPEADRESLSAEFLLENLSLALKAREVFPWAAAVPEEIFLNDVLPYAVFDEPRDPWRAEFFRLAGSLVEEAETASEAAQVLNREFFKQIKTHYHTDRKRTNQSPKESIEQGKATCTGLSILLVDACRAVGVPARAVGTPMWTNGRGNHTWVEIWDGGWQFTGADEYEAEGLNRGWFTGDAAKARAEEPKHAIYATSWKREGLSFPMIWSPGSTQVPAVNVTARYAQAGSESPVLGVRLSAEGPGDQRVAADGWLTSPAGRHLEAFTTKAGTADLNDLPRLTVIPGQRYRLSFGERGETGVFTAGEGEQTQEVTLAELTPLPAAVAALAADPLADPAIAPAEQQRVIDLLAEQVLEPQRAARAAELENQQITQGEHTLRWLERDFGEAPAGQRSLWISLHGGGGTTAEVNDQQWQNQLELYQPAEGIYLAPRAPTNAWDLWHQAPIDPLFARLIENLVALRGVDPERVYLLGYSAGGDGVWQLAPRMADRFAAAAMMAGHPNEASLLPLRNLPFAIFMGGEDAAYDRNRIARERIAQLEALEKEDPGGYLHLGRVYPGLGHWMEKKDAEALPWMAEHRRRSWPDRLVWVQDDVTHRRFYWLELPEDFPAEAGQKIEAWQDGQRFVLKGEVPRGTRVLLGPGAVALDQPVTLEVNGKTSTHSVTARAAVMRRALEQRLDPAACPVAELRVE